MLLRTRRNLRQEDMFVFSASWTAIFSDNVIKIEFYPFNCGREAMGLQAYIVWVKCLSTWLPGEQELGDNCGNDGCEGGDVGHGDDSSDVLVVMEMVVMVMVMMTVMVIVMMVCYMTESKLYLGHYGCLIFPQGGFPGSKLIFDAFDKGRWVDL